MRTTLQPKRSRRRGLTLMECVLATTVLAFCAVGAATALSAAYQQQRAAAAEDEALLLAEELAAVVAAQPYSQTETTTTEESSFSLLDLVTNTISSVNAILFDGYSDTVTTADGQTYTRRVSITEDASLGGAAIATIEVEAPNGSVARVRRLLVPEAQ